MSLTRNGKRDSIEDHVLLLFSVQYFFSFQTKKLLHFSQPHRIYTRTKSWKTALWGDIRLAVRGNISNAHLRRHEKLNTIERWREETWLFEYCISLHASSHNSSAAVSAGLSKCEARSNFKLKQNRSVLHASPISSVKNYVLQLYKWLLHEFIDYVDSTYRASVYVIFFLL